MTCRKFNTLVSAYLDGELTGAEMMAVREHSRSCEACAADLEDIRKLKLGMARLRPVAPSPDFESRILASLERAEARPAARLLQWLKEDALPRLQRSIPSSVAERAKQRVEPAFAGVLACGVLLLAVAGHLPWASDWRDNVAKELEMPPPVSAPARLVSLASAGFDQAPVQLETVPSPADRYAAHEEDVRLIPITQSGIVYNVALSEASVMPAR